VSGVSQRRIARNFGVNPKTVVRKFLFLVEQARIRHAGLLSTLARSPTKLELLQFDEMESFERSKCLPVSIPLVVDPITRRIIGIRACSMPAKGLLTRISYRKYGPRRDDRAKTASELFSSIQNVINENSDLDDGSESKISRVDKKAFSKCIAHHSEGTARLCGRTRGTKKWGIRSNFFAKSHCCNDQGKREPLIQTNLVHIKTYRST